MSQTMPVRVAALIAALFLAACGGEDRSASVACATLIEIDELDSTSDPDLSENQRIDQFLDRVDAFAGQVPEDLAADAESYASALRTVVEADRDDEDLEDDPFDSAQVTSATNRLSRFAEDDCSYFSDLFSGF
jgi:hypothetical protein